MSSSGDSAGADLRIICGPTAAGKSALAMTLAERHGLTIVSADSRQIYRGFDIGTAKPGVADRARVPHLGLDVAEPTERWSAARWAADAERWIAGLGAARALVVGGTGFYLRALVAPLFDAPPLDAPRRARLEGHLADIATTELRRWCLSLDPDLAHLGRAQLMRAIEVALLTGERLSHLQRHRARAPRLRARWLVVDPLGRLRAHIGERLDAMLAAGWIDEVRALDRRVPPDAPAWQACGYGTLRQCVRGGVGLDDARADILIRTRQYAKRQRTWFRHQLAAEPVTRVDPHDRDCESRAERWWEGDSTA